MNMITVRNLKKSFADNAVLKGVSFTVEQGETVVVIGPSGSGKSTMLRCIIGLERADGGDICIEGESLVKNGEYVSDARARKACAKMGMVFQNFNLFPHMSVLDNLITAPVSVKRISRDDAATQAKNILDEVGLSDKIHAYPNSLSGGQQQRVAIARALMMEPDMLLFDEPTSSLDPQLTAEVLLVMRRLTQKKMTMVVVTHEMGFAKEAADKILFMHDGYIIGEGQVDDIFVNPADGRIKEFIDSILS
jgi:polar amino acid transport system ATP-binding protein